eukprot:6735463-Alexandrium_andersonii.AAC.1
MCIRDSTRTPSGPSRTPSGRSTTRRVSLRAAAERLGRFPRSPERGSGGLREDSPSWWRAFRRSPASLAPRGGSGHASTMPWT